LAAGIVLAGTAMAAATVSGGKIELINAGNKTGSSDKRVFCSMEG
jgi:hypothetical protein